MNSSKVFNLIINPEKVLKGRALGEVPSSREVVGNTVKMAWPTVVDSFLSAIVSFVDMAMVSNLGTTAISAIGLTTQPRFIMLAFFLSLNVAVTAVVARRFGQKDRESANACLHQVLSIGLVMGLLLSFVSIYFARDLVTLAGAKADTVDDATTYFQTIMTAFLFSGLTLTINAAQRGVGKTRISMWTNLVSNGVNIICNYLLIEGHLGFPRLEVFGAALASAIGMFVGFIVAVVSLLRRNGYLKLKVSKLFHFTKSTMSALGKVWWSAAVEQLFLRIGFFIFAAIVANLGTDTFAIHNVGMNIMTLSFALGDGLSVAASALIGQNLGRGRSDLSEVYGKTCRRIGLIFSIILIIVFVLWGDLIFGIFIKERPDLADQGSVIMDFAAVITAIQIASVIYTGALRGAGDVKFVAVLMMLCVAILRPTTAYLFGFVFNWGLYGIWGSFLLDQSLRCVLSMIRFNKGKWKEIKV